MVRQPSLLNGIVLALLLLSGCQPKVSDEYRAADEIIDSKPASQETEKKTAQPADQPAPAEVAAMSAEAPKVEPQTPPAESKAMPASPAESASPTVAKETPAPTPAPKVPPVETPAAAPTTPTSSAPVASMAAPAEAMPASSSPATPAAKVSPENAAPAMPAGTPPLDPTAPPKVTGPLQIKLLIPEKTFTPEGSENALRVSFDDIDLLKVLNMEPVPSDAADHFPEWLKNLDGKRIVLRGWMYPPARQDGISSFLFVRDNGICCFGRAPKVYDKLGVKLRSGVTTQYIQNRPFDVIGTLSIEPEIEGDDEGLWWLYFINDAIIVDSQ
ncbi:hypothetical protein [Planctomicrobium sp. SH527]|uniref:hypothetical protein n=1 Tax=Planctomicrobium sp. SH527 TaxID=3448123 RepID=UPI003F5B23EE